VDHPQVPRLGEALARAGFAALLYWSPHMRDFRLDPEDIDNIALAYERLVQQPFVDGRRSGLFGTCVGGSFALMAAASPRIREGVSFVGAFAPYGSLFSLARNIASASRAVDGNRQTWQVDALTRKVFVHSVTARLDQHEADYLRNAHDADPDGASTPPPVSLSPEGQAIEALLNARTTCDADRALQLLPEGIRAGLNDLSPVNYVRELLAPMVAISHDRDDLVIPVSESRLLRSLVAGRPGVHYTDFEMFQHADPTKRKLSPLRLCLQLSKFYLWLHGVFRQATRRPN
jgi:hypothetical protein